MASLFPTDGTPAAVIDGATANPSDILKVLPSRRSMVAEPVDASRHLYAFVLHAEVFDTPLRRTVLDDDAAVREETWAEPREYGDGEEDEPRAADAADTSVGCEVVLSAVLPQGTSCSIFVSGWRPTIYLMPSTFLAAFEPSLGSLRNTIEELVKLMYGGARKQAVREGHSYRVVRKLRTYGYHPDPTNPAKRLEYPFLEIAFPSLRAMRQMVYAVKNVTETQEANINASLPPYVRGSFECGQVQAMVDSLRRRGGAMFVTIEEGDRVKPDFKFFDSREVAPGSWAAIPKGRYRLVGPQEPRASFRTVNVQLEDPRHLWSLEKLKQISTDRPELTADAPDVNKVPPCLFGYCDIESRSHSLDEFPDPLKPEARCYMVGMSFAWAFGVPPALRRPAEGVGAPDLEHLAEEKERIAMGAAAEKERARAEALQKRHVRLEKRRERMTRLRENSVVREIILGRVDELNSDDESDGEEVAVARAEAEHETKMRHEVQLCESMHQTLPWTARRKEGAAAVGVLPAYPFARVLLVLGPCAPIPGAVVITFPRDAEGEIMLLNWIKIILFGVMDVDGIRGYNWLGFDTRYIVRRAELLGVADTALRWSHMPARPLNYDKKDASLSLQTGSFRMVRLHGTNTVDMFVYMRQQLQLSSYKLDAVAQHFGIDGKHPVTFVDIYHAYDDATGVERARVGAYCLRDCDVLVDMARVSQFEVTLMQFMRIMLTPAEQMWSSGQQIRVVNQIMWQGHRRGFVVDGLFRDRSSEDTALRTLDSGKSFSGGFVMKPVVAHHRTPTATMDYKSLYPSIMISHKLCFSTALLAPYDSPEWVERIRKAGAEVLRIETESGTFHFVQSDLNIVPDMEWALWTQRQQIKKLMKSAADPLVHAVLDAKQLAVKVSMNSTFGVTGAAYAMLGMKRIAASITHVGRTTVQAARDYADSLSEVVTEVQSPATGAKAIVPVIKGALLRTVYGDTDSIMVNLPSKACAAFVHHLRGVPLPEGCAPTDLVPLKKAEMLYMSRVLGDYVSGQLNQRYRHPMEIEFEEVASNAIFLAPKMYTKNVVEDISDKVLAAAAAGTPIGKLKVAGIAAKRRDRAAIVSRIQKQIAECIVHLQDEPRALLLIRRWFSRAALAEMDLEAFISTNELKNPMEKIGTVPQPHVAVAWAMEKKARGSEPIKGERVPWVVVRQADPTRLTPPDTKKVSQSEIYLEGATPIGRVRVSQLCGILLRKPVGGHIIPDGRQFWFGERNLSELAKSSPSLTCEQLGLGSGHRLTVRDASKPGGGKVVEFRLVWDNDQTLSDEDEAVGEDDDDDAAGTPPLAKKPRPSSSAVSHMMFRAREMTKAEQQNLGKRRAAASKAEQNLAVFARHPDELPRDQPLRGTIDTRKYLEMMHKSLEILLATTRPDLWVEIHKIYEHCGQLLSMAEGKPRQSTLRFKRV